ncbi:MAG: hypothetical protein K1000chlam2_01380 [Chlamydiae bacterium]|nr:hypothetical protein [Chlamydiota bacterium]
MGVATFIDRALQSPVGKVVFQNWNKDIPKEQTSGHVWSDPQIENQSYHCFHPTGEYYPAEKPQWAFAKAIGIAIIGEYYFGARAIGSLGALGYNVCRVVHGNYNLMKDSEGFSYTSFAISQFSNFHLFKNDVVQLGKDLACFAPFYLDLFGMGTLLKLGVSGYAVYNPLMIRVWLNKVEEWQRPRGVQPLTDKEVSDKQPRQLISDMVNGSYTLAHLFNMQKVDANSKKDN